jgi:hypothetical protein
MFYLFCLLALFSLVLGIIGAVWDTIVTIQDVRLKKRLKEEAVPDPYEACQYIIWRKPLRQFVPPLLTKLGFLLIWNLSGLVPYKSAQDQQEAELLRLIVNIVVPALMIFDTWRNWQQWQRYGGRNNQR